MSTKTLRKRIALVAVSAMGFGLLTSVGAHAGAVAAGNLDFNDLATQPGVCYIHNGSTAGDTYATVVAGSKFKTTIVDSVDSAYVSVTGNATVDSIAGALDSATLTDATDAGTTTSDVITFKAGAVGSAKISIAATSAAASVDTLGVTIVASCSGDTLSVGDNYYTAVGSTAAADGSWTETAVDASGALTIANGSYGYVKVRLNDGYGNNLATTGALVATAGTGCVVGLAAHGGSLVPGKSNSAVLSTAGVDDVAIVGQATADAPASCTVTTTFNGTTVGTKTFTIQGAPKKVTVSDVTVGQATSGGYGYYRTTVMDSAGNLLPGAVISASSAEANNAAALASGVIAAVQSNTGAATSSTAGSGYGKTQAVTAANVTTGTSGANGLTRFTCTTTSGTAKLTVRTPVDSVNSAYITSDPFTVNCGGSLATWSVSLDKSSYAPGEIATLTLKGLDSNGKPSYTFNSLSGVVYSFGGMTAVTAPTNGDVLDSGIGTKTYQFSVGTSEGAFVGTFTTTGSVDTAAKTVQYKVAASSASVTNAEVIAAIVKLIASINKQIAALQKALKK